MSASFNAIKEAQAIEASDITNERAEIKKMLLNGLAFTRLGALPFADEILRGESGHESLSPNGYGISIQENSESRKQAQR